jgi:hypothetical protein
MNVSRSTFVRGALALATATFLSACGGDPASVTTLKVVPAKGVIVNGVVTVYPITGQRSTLTATTNEDGYALVNIPSDIFPSSKTAPLVVRVTASENTRMWDEHAKLGMGTWRSGVELDDFELLTLVPQVGAGQQAEVGATVLTTMSATAAGISDVEALTERDLTSDEMVDAIARTSALFGLPSSFNINSVPTPVTGAAGQALNDYGELIRMITIQSPTSALDQLASFRLAGTTLSELSPGTLPDQVHDLSSLVYSTAQTITSIEGIQDTVPTTTDELSERAQSILEEIRRNLISEVPTGATGAQDLSALGQ